jgi:hypothetical protein
VERDEDESVSNHNESEYEDVNEEDEELFGNDH